VLGLGAVRQFLEQVTRTAKDPAATRSVAAGERPRSPAAAAGETLNSEKPPCRRGQVQRSVRRRLLLAEFVKPLLQKRALLSSISVLVRSVQPLTVIKANEVEAFIGQIAVTEFRGLVNVIKGFRNRPRSHAMVLDEINESKKPTQDYLAGNGIEASLTMAGFNVEFPCHAGHAKVFSRSLVLLHE
jgi:hypothetical protein